MTIKLQITRKVLFEKFSIQHEKEDFFLSFLNGCDIKITKDYPDSIFYLKNDKVLFEQDFRSKHFKVRYSLVWSVLRNKYFMEIQEIQSFIKKILINYLKLEDFTPTLLFQLDKVFSLDDFTPHTAEKTLDDKFCNT